METWYESNLPEALIALNRGASKSAITRFEEQIGLELPDDLRESFSIHNGENATKICVGCVYGLNLLSLDGCYRQWKSWNGIIPIPELDEDAESIPKGYVRPHYFHSSWIPLTHDGSGNHIAVDLAPGEHGTVGQIIVCGRDDLTHYVAAHSFSHFLRHMLDELTGGNFIIRRQGNRTLFTDVPMVEFKPKTPKVDHFHVAICSKRFHITG